MNAWSVRQYEEIKNGILTDIANLSKRLSAAEAKLKVATGKEKHTQEEEVKKLEGYLAETNENLRRFEFRYTHNGRGPEECNEELPPEGEAKKRKREQNSRKISTSIRLSLLTRKQVNLIQSTSLKLYTERVS